MPHWLQEDGKEIWHCKVFLAYKDWVRVRIKGILCELWYGAQAGWFSPLGALLASGAIEEVREDADVQDDAESIAAFFSKVCAPRTTSSGPKVGGTSWDKLCSGCAGDCTTHDR